MRLILLVGLIIKANCDWDCERMMYTIYSLPITTATLAIREASGDVLRQLKVTPLKRRAKQRSIANSSDTVEDWFDDYS